MPFRADVTTKINLNENYKDIQLISFKDGKQLFWYKHKVDVAAKKVYWVFVLIGLKRNTKYYEYEFEVRNGPTQKFKVNDYCKSDNDDIEKIFREEKCVVMSFSTIKNYLNNEGELSFRFRIRNIGATNA